MKIIKIILMLLIPAVLKAQQSLPDSTKIFLQNASNDSIRYRANTQAYNYFEERNRDSALYYEERCILLTRKNNKKLLEVSALDRKGYQLSGMGRYAEALPCFLEGFKISE